MARCYIRVPVYLAEYLRNRDAAQPVPRGECVSFPENSSVYLLLGMTIRDNPSGRYRGIDSLSEKQFQYICSQMPAGALPSGMDVARITGYGKNIRQEGEYVAVTLPREVLADGVRRRPSATWAVSPASVPTLTKELLRMFWSDFFEYIDRDQKFAQAQRVSRTVIEGIERFMERYDISNGYDNRVMNKLRRNYYRKQSADAFSAADVVEHSAG